MNNKIKSLFFDFIQVSSILFVLFTGPLIASNIFLIFLQILSILIIVHAGWEMRKTQFYRVPDIGKQKHLVTTGIYQYVRNPMYLSQLLFFGVLVVDLNSIFRMMVFIIFLSNFILKIQYEEELLLKYFKEFTQYKKSSWRLIPFIY